MSNLKWIMQKEFEEYLSVKEFMELNDFNESDLRKKIGERRPIPISLKISSDNMEPKRYEWLTNAANNIKVPKKTLIYVYENRRELITRRKGRVKVFYIEWLES